MIDIVIFAVVAIFIFARLWAVFGERHDDDPEHPNPFAPRMTRPKDKPEDEDFVVRPQAVSTNQDAPVLLPSLYAVTAPPQSLAGGLEAVQKLDPSFNEKKFLQGAKAAFGMIVSNFAKDDLSQVERLLAPVVLAGFKQAIKARQDLGQMLETNIKEVRDAEITTARVEKTSAIITVQFISLQVNILRDKMGQVLDGAPDQVTEVRDLWTFARDAKSADPNWQLIGTKS